MTYVSVCTVSSLPAASVEKNFSVVLAEMEMAAVYLLEERVGVLPSMV